MSDFLFDDSELDPATASKIVNDVINGADDGELYIERGTSEGPVSYTHLTLPTTPYV